MTPGIAPISDSNRCNFSDEDTRLKYSVLKHLLRTIKSLLHAIQMTSKNRQKCSYKNFMLATHNQAESECRSLNDFLNHDSANESKLRLDLVPLHPNHTSPKQRHEECVGKLGVKDLDTRKTSIMDGQP